MAIDPIVLAIQILPGNMGSWNFKDFYVVEC